ncbi:MAG: xanthine dehydrogenase family protein molybdopterin-binding subunit [Rhodospirillales bacterium]|jgi:carbon-monoxide dehydrogenase large subunit|nr:xanthine dehydrogenase family protein molybdopterin-binding subunit [Rhodospirillales bacterium]MBT5075070.1 xanthine dehydrogenase family protein molybdopterin-binding subunit [Rhodospirillales bacterium]MBT5114062.1 xanthine dehydrogenase family protein molybdopterin-binding subunit [Rhodospirillales bacterium]MBT5672590.1 xanthine dehydrogenase family protein molybdopterin-binding subunit [Rhodospirillales bacterium]MBT6185740.1 xanthine dehydrogenase family protein molybdopterin-binding 
MVIGASIRRKEDPRLLTGAGCFTDDINRPNQAYGAFVRSPHAHADILSINKTTALKMPGVLGVYDFQDMASKGCAEISTGIAGRGDGYPSLDGSPMADPPYYVLANGRARYVGEPVAMVIATCPEGATAAAEAIFVDYQSLIPVTIANQADRPDQPQLWPEAKLNTCYNWGSGDGDAVSRALDASDHVTILDVEIPRVVPSFLEPRAAMADYDGQSGRFELYVGCQGIHGLRDKLAEALGVGADRVRVVSLDVGGAFGARSVIYPEYLALAWAAREIARPIKWTATRAEDFVTTTQGRDNFLRGELGQDGMGKFLALRVTGHSNMGARHTGNGPYSVMRNLARMLPGTYRTPAVYMALKGVFTNTVPVSSYRGVGRMEAIFVMERLVDRAAKETGFDRIELRRKNLIRSHLMPYETPMGAVYDSGNYVSNMEKAMEAANWDGFPDRRETSARAGLLRGIGICNYIEGAGGGAGEYAAIEIDETGMAEVRAGCVDQGQGHQTSLSQIAADHLGIGVDQVVVAASDTDVIADGVGTNASRSMVRAGEALVVACGRLIDQGREAAALLLQANKEDVIYDHGRYLIGDREIGLADIAKQSRFFAEYRSHADAVTFPNGCHVCEVEIDPETGALIVVAFTAVDDVGVAINPPIVDGQSQGAIAQGIGQGLMECSVVDPKTGQMLSGSYLDYAMPRANDLPSLKPIANNSPSPTNSMGVKGAGEGGTTGAPAAVINAVLDALSFHGVTDITMPATPYRIWAAIRDGSVMEAGE